MDDKLCTSEEIGRQLGVSGRTVRRRASVNDGIERVGRMYRVVGRPEADVTESGHPEMDTVRDASEVGRPGDPERDNGFIVLRDSYQNQKEIIRRLEVEADDYRALARGRGRLNMILTAALFPTAVLIAWSIATISSQADKIATGKNAQAGLAAQIATEQGRAALLAGELGDVRQTAQDERQQLLSQIDKLTGQIVNLSTAIESERQKPAELNILDLMEPGGPVVIGPEVQPD